MADDLRNIESASFNIKMEALVSGKPQRNPIQKVNEAYERLLKSDARYRFSIDMASLKSE
jgi:D-arabinose 1-dehydrogenase-like Zn-dependent alcohol dehydrogenase